MAGVRGLQEVQGEGMYVCIYIGDRSLGQGDPLEGGMETRSSILAWRIPWTEEPGGLQTTGSH